MTPTNYAVEQLVTDALTAALRADVYGVAIYDYAENELLNLNVTDETEQALRKLRNLRDVWMADEVAWMLEKAPLKQGHDKDGVVSNER